MSDSLDPFVASAVPAGVEWWDSRPHPLAGCRTGRGCGEGCVCSCHTFPAVGDEVTHDLGAGTVLAVGSKTLGETDPTMACVQFTDPDTGRGYLQWVPVTDLDRPAVIVAREVEDLLEPEQLAALRDELAEMARLRRGGFL